MRTKMALLLSMAVMSLAPLVSHAAVQGASGSGTFTGALVGGKLTVVYECTGVAVGAAATTRMNACYLRDPATHRVLHMAHDRGCQLQPNADAATVIDIGTLGGNAPDNILGGQYRYHLPSP